MAQDKIQLKSFQSSASAGASAFGISGNISGSQKTEFFRADLLKDGYVAISSGDYLAFPTSGEPYASVYTESGYPVCENYRPSPDISIIVTADRSIKQAKYGVLFVDVDGKRHN